MAPHGPTPAPAAAATTCLVVRPDEAGASPQGLTSFAGISAERGGARALCMHLVTIPPGGRGRAHLHAGHETALYVLSGESEMWYGEGLREYLVARAGDFVFIPAGVPHLPANRSQSEPCTAVIARTDPCEQESVVLLPALDALARPG